jgi:hypothetical protein
VVCRSAFLHWWHYGKSHAKFLPVAVYARVCAAIDIKKSSSKSIGDNHGTADDRPRQMIRSDHRRSSAFIRG